MGGSDCDELSDSDFGLSDNQLEAFMREHCQGEKSKTLSETAGRNSLGHRSSLGLSDQQIEQLRCACGSVTMKDGRNSAPSEGVTRPARGSSLASGLSEQQIEQIRRVSAMVQDDNACQAGNLAIIDGSSHGSIARASTHEQGQTLDRESSQRKRGPMTSSHCDGLSDSDSGLSDNQLKALIRENCWDEKSKTLPEPAERSSLGDESSDQQIDQSGVLATMSR
jgi:hypothetical protein